ncbi:MAG: hypothetical protein FD155_1361 [Bacteroidetes bacterium]|nr:MAG: hypothetical protein FD155_1361 [Bacteroidota bacterium]
MEWILKRLKDNSSLNRKIIESQLVAFYNFSKLGFELPDFDFGNGIAVYLLIT